MAARARRPARTRGRLSLDLRHRGSRHARLYRTRHREPQGAQPRSETVSKHNTPALGNRGPGRMGTEVSHKGQVYPGEHQAIVSRELWDKVHAILQVSPWMRTNQNRQQAPALLKGLIF